MTINDIDKPVRSNSESTTSDRKPINQRLTFVLAVIGCLALLKIRWDSVLHDAKWIPIVDSAFYLLSSIVLLLWPAPFKRRTRVLLIAAGILTPILSFLILRIFGKGEATEILMMQVCQNVALVSVAVGRTRGLQQQSVLFSFFLVFFVTTLSETPAVFLFAIPYLMLGVWWLMTNHWSRLEAHMPNRTTSNFRVRSVSFLATLILLVLVGSFVGWNHQPIMKTINGFMPTSGGSRYSDRFARGGLGDGDFFVAATQHASTVGPVESDLFLESPKPSLFDIVEENYGRPALPVKKKSERAFSPDNVTMKRAENQLVQSEQSGRTFRILRETNQSEQPVTENKSDALFYLEGPVPIRLSLRYFDHFDGLDWSVSQNVESQKYKDFVAVELGEKFWIKFKSNRLPQSRDKEGSSSPQHPYFQGYENHSIKVIRLDTNRILAPSSFAGWHFNLCDQVSFFRRTKDGAIEFAGRDSLPELAVYHLVSQGVNYGRLKESSEISLSSSISPYSNCVEYPSRTKIRNLAKAWSKGAHSDFEKADAIVQHLRHEYRFLPNDASDGLDETLNNQNSEPASEPPIEKFFRMGGGPDYLFATVAAMMIRELGMEARLVNGFYVDQKDFDSYSAQSIVHACNFHSWIEVRANGRDWITMEPTPGFSLPRTKFTWSQRIANLFFAAVNWMASHPVQLTTIVIAIGLIWLLRMQLYDLAILMIWQVEKIGSQERRVLATLKLLRRRQRSTVAADKSLSVAELCDHVVSQDSEQSHEKLEWIEVFKDACNRLLYQPNPNLADLPGLAQACRSIACAPSVKTKKDNCRTRSKRVEQNESNQD